MRALIQRVNEASVTVEGKIVSSIGRGLCAFIGIKKDDTQADATWLANKILNLRIFPGEEKPIDKCLLDVGGELLLVSQFTLYGDCRKGNRPSFIEAMPPAQAKEFYENFVALCRREYPQVKDGVFQAYMDVALINDGPTTILLESPEKKKSGT